MPLNLNEEREVAEDVREDAGEDSDVFAEDEVEVEDEDELRPVGLVTVNDVSLALDHDRIARDPIFDMDLTIRIPSFTFPPQPPPPPLPSSSKFPSPSSCKSQSSNPT